jgi:hypothetical protein
MLYPGIYLSGLRKTTNNFTLNNQFLSLDLKPGPSYSKCKGMLPTLICGEYRLTKNLNTEYKPQAYYA